METRKKEFQKNNLLENLLYEVNTDLQETEKKLLRLKYDKYPIIIVMGALRSGTTLTMQWLANTGQFSYPTNFISRFYQAPIVGAKIQKLLLDPAYNFRNEIVDFSRDVNYCSENGKTKGAMAPNEFWYFWRRFLHYDLLPADYISDDELKNIFDVETFVQEILGVANVFGKPFAIKGMIANYNIGFLDSILDNVIFLYIKREPSSNIKSVLEARNRQSGNEKMWYSFRIPEMNRLQCIEDPEEQIAGQLFYINKAIQDGLKNVSEERKMEMRYEDFCQNPEKYYNILRGKIRGQGYEISSEYHGEKQFKITRNEDLSQIQDKYNRFLGGINDGRKRQ